MSSEEGDKKKDEEDVNNGGPDGTGVSNPATEASSSQPPQKSPESATEKNKGNDVLGDSALIVPVNPKSSEEQVKEGNGGGETSSFSYVLNTFLKPDGKGSPSGGEIDYVSADTAEKRALEQVFSNTKDKALFGLIRKAEAGNFVFSQVQKPNSPLTLCILRFSSTFIGGSTYGGSQTQMRFLACSNWFMGESKEIIRRVGSGTAAVVEHSVFPCPHSLKFANLLYVRRSRAKKADVSQIIVFPRKGPSGKVYVGMAGGDNDARYYILKAWNGDDGRVLFKKVKWDNVKSIDDFKRSQFDLLSLLKVFDPGNKATSEKLIDTIRLHVFTALQNTPESTTEDSVSKQIVEGNSEQQSTSSGSNSPPLALRAKKNVAARAGRTNKKRRKASSGEQSSEKPAARKTARKQQKKKKLPLPSSSGSDSVATTATGSLMVPPVTSVQESFAGGLGGLNSAPQHSFVQHQSVTPFSQQQQPLAHQPLAQQPLAQQQLATISSRPEEVARLNANMAIAIAAINSNLPLRQ